MKAICHDSGEKAQVIFPLPILEDDDFKVVVGQFDAAGDFKISPIVAHAGDEGEAGAVFRAVHRYMKAGDGAAELAKATVPVRQFAEAGLEFEIEFVNDAGIQSDAGHQDEVVAQLAGGVESAEGYTHGNALEQLCGGDIGAAGKTQLIRENIGGAGRQYSEWNAGARKTVDCFVDGAIAARSQDQVAALGDGLCRYHTREPGTRRGEKLDLGPGASENVNSGIKTCTTVPFQASGERVVDHSDTMDCKRNKRQVV